MAWEQHGLEHHFKKAGKDDQAACGCWFNYAGAATRFASGQYVFTDKIEEVTCGRCKYTLAYRVAVRRVSAAPPELARSA